MQRRRFLRSLTGAVAGLWKAKWTVIPILSSGKLAVTEGSPEFRLNARGIGVEVSAAGEIVGLVAGGRTIRVLGRTSLAGCTQVGAAKEEKLSKGAIQFTRTLK